MFHTFVWVIVSEDMIVSEDDSAASCQLGRLKDLCPIDVSCTSFRGYNRNNTCMCVSECEV